MIVKGPMQGPFALPLNGVKRKILNTWGSRLTWTTRREHDAQNVCGGGVGLSFCDNLWVRVGVWKRHGVGAGTRVAILKYWSTQGT